MPLEALANGLVRLALAGSALMLTLLPGTASAQTAAAVLGWDGPGVRYVEAASLAVALGDVATVAEGALTWRGAQGVATFFLGSSQALLQAPGSAGPDEWALSAPVLRFGPDELERLASAPPAHASAGWMLPLDAVQLLGVAAEGAEGAFVTGFSGVITLHLPGGGVSALVLPAPVTERPDSWMGAAWEVTEIGGSPALRFYAGERLSLLLLDLDLTPLAFPEVTAIVDEAAARIGSDHALLLIVSALEESPWESRMVFEQDGRVLEVRHPYRLRVYRGSADVVGPDEPAAGVVMLPASFSLYRPLKVYWADLEATVTFRR